MAKAIKPKVEKVKKVNPPTVTEPIVEETKIETIPEPVIEEPEIGETPPSVTLDEVKEVVEEPIVELKMPTTIHIDDVPVKAEVVDLPMEQKILNFVEIRSGDIKMNDFLKSLFPIPAFGAPPTWNNQGASKLLKNTLDGMVREGKIKIKNDMHRRLATFYYPDNNSGKTEYHTIGSVSIIAQKVN